MITDFGKRLTKLLENQKISNSEITKELELSKNAIGNYKKDQIPNAQILYKISQKLGVTMEYLLSGKETIQEYKELIEAYKKADIGTRTAVDKLLDIKDQGKLSTSEKDKIG